MGKQIDKVENKLVLVMECLKNYINDKGYPPSYRELSKLTGIKSTNSIKKYMDMLEERNLITKENAKNRATKVLSNDIEMQEHLYLKENTISVPLLGKITAGIPILAQEEREETFILSKNIFSTTENIFLLKVSGNSMIGVDIHDGDYAVIKQQNYAENGNIVAALIEDSATIKTFYTQNNKIRLQPQNPAYAPIILDECSILGIVIGIIRKF